ncbi:kinase-like protein [Auricularia subglabra TFB-10046 SS5]|nr:kinase-like protein [Auricularia subglabra TFB-10046 SS5]
MRLPDMEKEYQSYATAHIPKQIVLRGPTDSHRYQMQSRMPFDKRPELVLSMLRAGGCLSIGNPPTAASVELRIAGHNALSCLSPLEARGATPTPSAALADAASGMLQAPQCAVCCKLLPKGPGVQPADGALVRGHAGCGIACLGCTSLREWISSHPEEDRRAALRCVVALLQFLHSMGLVHGDLNTTNIFVHDNRVVLADLKHCGMGPVPACASGTEPGTYYAPPGLVLSMAPELVTGVMRTTETDVYAFGMLIFELYAGHGAFSELRPYDRSRVSAMVQLCNGKRPTREEILRPDFTDELWALTTECWAQEPSARPTMDEVCARIA